MGNYAMMDVMLTALAPRERTVMMILRLITLAAIISLSTMHVRTMRVFRWEQSVSGGILVTYSVCLLGLCLCAGMQDCGGEAFQAFICGSGAALFALNAGMLWRRWNKAGELTRIVAELLVTLGMQLKWQLRCKIAMSAVIAGLLLVDMAMNPIIGSEPRYGCIFLRRRLMKIMIRFRSFDSPNLILINPKILVPKYQNQGLLK